MSQRTHAKRRNPVPHCECGDCIGKRVAIINGWIEQLKARSVAIGPTRPPLGRGK